MSLPRINDRRPHYLSCVVGLTQIAMADAADCRVYTRPAGLMHDFGDFLARVHVAMGRPAEAVVALVANADVEAAVTHAAARGWQQRTAVAESAWSTYVHDVTGETLHVVDLDQLAAWNPSAWLLGHEPAALAVKLAAYNHATGTAYRATPGVTGCALVRRLHAEAAERKAASRKGAAGQPFWRYDRHPIGLAPMGDLKWTADSTPTSGYVAQFDTRAAYLAAASAAMLAWSPLRHTGSRMFDPAAAGYWQVYAADLPDLHDGRPFVVDPTRVGSDGTVWLTTPVMDYLCSRGSNPDVLDSHTCDQAGRYLRPWAETIRDGLAAATDPDVVDALKATYRETVGMFNRPGGSVHRPDWWATIIDMARVNLLRKVDKAYKAAGVYPVRVYVDAVYYHADHLDQLAAVAALPTGLGVDTAGRQIGKLRPVAQWTADEYAARTTRRPRRRPAVAR